MISHIKSTINMIAGKAGYRIVPRSRDPQTLLRYAEQLSVTAVVDIGANAGHTCAHWLQVFPEVHVHAIEVLDFYRSQLAAVAAKFPGRMTIWPVAATHSHGQLMFHVHLDHPSSSSLRASTTESHSILPFTKSKKEIEVQGVRLDRLFEQNAIDLGTKVLIKIDVQGAELDALKGCEGFLADVVCVLCEVNLTHVYEGQPTLTELVSYLATYGLQLAGFTEQFHSPDGRAVYLDALFLRPPMGLGSAQ